MSDERLVTVAEYATAFETWATASSLGGTEAVVLTEALTVLRSVFTHEEEALPITAYCRVFEGFLYGRSRGEGRAECGHLRLRIKKSCLLDRLLYGGEPLSQTPCPLHKGQWSGLRPESCPHGCDAACGCTSGWVPSAETLAKRDAYRVEHAPAAAARLRSILDASLTIGVGVGEVLVYAPKRAKVSVPAMVEGVPVRVVRVGKAVPA